MSTNSNGIFSWVRRVLSRAARPNGARGCRFIPRMELLEERDVPTTFTVTTLSDLPVQGQRTLRQSLADLLNLGTANNVIQFAPGLTGTINLGEALPDPQKNVDIVGPGPGLLTIAGDPNAANKFNIFTFANQDDASILVGGLTIQDGRTFQVDGHGAGIFANGPNSLTAATT